MRVLAIGLLVRALGGCGSVANLATNLAIGGAAGVAGGVPDYGTQPAPQMGPVAPWKPGEPRVGSTGGSWTGVCDPKCPVKP